MEDGKNLHPCHSKHQSVLSKRTFKSFMNKILTIVTLFVLVVPVIWGQDSVIDIDGNVYETVQIGEQLWMKENLKVTHYRNGDEIPTGYSDAVWENLTTGAYAVYDNLSLIHI